MISGTISHYRILEKLGAGGMGEVYLAKDMSLDRTVALKVLATDVARDREQIRRFVQEAKAASALRHPNVAHIYEIGEADDIRFIAMEYVEGQSLDTKISGRPLESAEIVNLGLQVADALDEAHSKGIIHRDIKPANLMITSRGQVKVLDFGLAKVIRPEGETLAADAPTLSKTKPGLVMGTVPYMSPEQALGRHVDPRTDIFSLGVVLYEMATGRLPFLGANASEILDQIIHAQPEVIARFNYNLPAELERIIRKCLEKEPERRYQSARELVIDLRNLQRDLELGAGGAETIPPRPRRQRYRSAFAAFALAILLLVVGTLYFFMGGGEAIDSVAVLPFTNASADPNMEYLSDGISESIINRLSQLPGLRVMARSTMFRYKSQEVDPRSVGRQLHVQAVLTGRVLQVGETLIIRAELVDVKDGLQLWGEQYNRRPADILTLQEEISRKISEELRLRLTGEQQKRLTRKYTDDVEAYLLYLKGRYAWNQRTEERLRKSIEYFREAIEKDPRYALAYVGLADAHALLGGLGVGALPPKETMPKAKAAAMKALEIDDTLAEAHASLGLVKWSFDWDWLGAEQELKRAIELRPSYATAHQWYALDLIAMGRLDDALGEMKRAQRFDPLSQAINMGVGWVLYLRRQYDQAIEQYRKTLDMEPTSVYAHAALGVVYEQKAMAEAAIGEIQRAMSLSGGSPEMTAALGHAYAVSGQRSKAQKILIELSRLSKRRYVPAYSIARIYIGLGRKDQAFKWLQKAYEERAEALVYLNLDPTFDSLRSDPRFIDLVRRVGLAP